MTPNQNLVIANLAPGLRPRIDALVAEHGLDGYRSASPLRQRALACVALPTCGLAMAEAERYLSDFVDAVDVLLLRHGRSAEHTSELQSLMRISYAVFCLTKKQ